jgi:hypothetical protein
MDPLLDEIFRVLLRGGRRAVLFARRPKATTLIPWNPRIPMGNAVVVLPLTNCTAGKVFEGFASERAASDEQNDNDATNHKIHGCKTHSKARAVRSSLKLRDTRPLRITP